MGLNKSTGNMYSFVDFTWNTIKGECPHGCEYCFCKRWGPQKPPRFDENEIGEFDRDMKKFGDNKFIFVGSSCDMFAEEIPFKWVLDTLQHCSKYNNRYFFQTKNPRLISECGFYLPDDSAVCTTIETNRHYPDIMQYSPLPTDRAIEMGRIDLPKYVTIEPIMQFDLTELVEMISACKPMQVNIGADSMGKNLPEPEPYKIYSLINELSKFTKVHQKSNLKRIL